MIKYILRETKKYINYIIYKNTIPSNPNNSDLYIVEFPKSGITWLSTIIANTCFLEEGINIKATHFNLEQFIGDVHQTKNILRNNFFPYYRIIKSHDNYNPYYRHVVYLIRNPFSVMNSYYNFTLNNNAFRGDFESFIKDEKYGIKKWVEHVNSWTNPKKVLKLHLLRYEDLIEKPEITIKNLYKNLGWDIENEKIQKAIELSRFKNMKDLNDHYKKYCPFRKYDFVREGKKQATISINTEKYIRKNSIEILKKFYPELV